MSPIADPRAALAYELARPEAEARIERIALLVAAEEYVDLDLDRYLDAIEALAAGARARLSGDEGPAGVVAAINGHLFRESGFHGNETDYYDPRNSYLNDVIDRRTGLPITLSILYMAVARRLGHRLSAINLPFHFMLAWDLPDGPMLIDPFNGGAIVTRRDCADRLQRIVGHPIELGDQHFASVGVRPIARRLLNNLLGVYLRADQPTKALAALERMYLAQPVPRDHRDRGGLLVRLNRLEEAQRAYLAYLSSAPRAPDREVIEQRLARLQRPHAGDARSG